MKEVEFGGGLWWLEEYAGGGGGGGLQRALVEVGGVRGQAPITRPSPSFVLKL